MGWTPEFERALRIGLSGAAIDRPVAPDETFAALGVSSLGIVELLLLVEEHLGVEIPVEDLDPSSFEGPGLLWEAVRGLPRSVTTTPASPAPGSDASDPPFR